MFVETEPAVGKDNPNGFFNAVAFGKLRKQNSGKQKNSWLMLCQ